MAFGNTRKNRFFQLFACRAVTHGGQSEKGEKGEKKYLLTSVNFVGIIGILKAMFMALKCCGFPGILEGGKYTRV